MPGRKPRVAKFAALANLLTSLLPGATHRGEASIHNLKSSRRCRIESLESRIVLTVGDAYEVPLDPRIELDVTDDWRFQYNASGSPQSVAYNDSSWATVDLPHTWNGVNGQDGGSFYNRGNGWYRKTLTAGEIASLAGKTIYLQFEGASIVTDLYVDGVQVDFNPVTSEDSHVGGFATFNFDLTSLLSQGSSHLLAVRTSNNNFESISPPQAGDFTKYGGIYRDVSLVGVDPTHIALRERATTPLDWNEDGILEVTNTPIATPGFYFEATAVGASSADVQVVTRLDNLAGAPRDVLVRSVLVDDQGVIVSEESDSQTLAANATSVEVVQASMVANPRLWNGRIDPYLYDLYIEVIDVGTNQVIDLMHDRVGIRTFEINAYNPSNPGASGFQLNGEDYNLHGMNYHQDARDVGWAKSDAQTLADVQQMLELGVTYVRTAHYQHSQYFYDLADEYGIILWTETAINGTGGNIPDNVTFFHNSADQLHELIRQNYNHASIIVWGMHNEVSSSNATNQRFMRQMNPLARAEDPTRLTTSNSTNNTVNDYDRLGDSVAMSRYSGWYGGSPADLATWADQNSIKNSNFPVGIGEYGGGASLYHHTSNVADLMSDPNNKQWHPENYQAWIHEQLWPIIAARPWLWGTTAWLMYDFGSDGRNEGAQPGINDKGIATLDREVKDAYLFYKANWNDPSRSWNNEKVLEIADSRWVDRHDSQVTVKVYSNLGAPTLSLNGVSLGAMSPYSISGAPIPNTYSMVLNLAAAANDITVSSEYDDVRYEDSVNWRYHAPILDGTAEARVDFTDNTANLEPGYVADTGQPYGPKGAANYGWIDATSLNPASNNTGYMDPAGPAPFNELRFLSGVQLPNDRVWEYELPNGVYDVRVAAADSGFTNMINNMSLEGLLLQDDDFVLNAGNPGDSPDYDEFYARVAVTDGRLTLGVAPGAYNVRLAFIDINRFDPPPLSGDYNGDNKVNAADYTVWRDASGKTVVPYTGGDGNGDGVVDALDYEVWVSQYGKTYTPPPIDNLVLVLNPAMGTAYLRNQTSSTLWIDGYSISSAQNLLLPSDGAWLSLADQALVGWDEASPTGNLLTELNPFGALLLEPGDIVALGAPLVVGAATDGISFQYSLEMGEESLPGSIVIEEAIPAAIFLSSDEPISVNDLGSAPYAQSATANESLVSAPAASPSLLRAPWIDFFTSPSTTSIRRPSRSSDGFRPTPPVTENQDLVLALLPQQVLHEAGDPEHSFLLALPTTKRLAERVRFRADFDDLSNRQAIDAAFAQLVSTENRHPGTPL